jgi:SulP family sulfate permease
MAQHDRSPRVVGDFTPKILTAYSHGYSLATARADALAGLTVAIVALPLSMAIAIASGANPAQGLFTAIVGGFLISALGGSRYQIGGPAGAFIVLVAATIAKHGYDGFLIATMMAGLMLLAVGYLRLGVYIKYIPHPVVVGFTAGIGVVIFASQIKELFGLTLDHEPGELAPKIAALWSVKDSVNLSAVAVSALALALILGLRAWRPRWPGLLIAIAVAAAAASALHLPVETIGSRYGAIPSSLPAPRMPSFSFTQLIELVPAAAMIAMLGGIESLLSAVVADGMSGSRHRSNCELVAQGYANIASALFGGLCATGTIARTATNIRSGAIGPMAGVFHAIFVLAILFVAAPLVAYVPLAALAALLAVVSWNMVEKAEIARLIRGDRAEAAVLAVTFLLTIFRDLSEGIAAGVTLGAVVFMHRMASAVQVTTDGRVEGGPEGQDRDNDDAGVVVYRIAGPFFFGAASQVAQTLKRVGRAPKVYILDLSFVPMVDATAAHELEGFVDSARRSGAKVFLAGPRSPVLRTLLRSGFDRHLVRVFSDVEAARAAARGEPQADLDGTSGGSSEPSPAASSADSSAHGDARISGNANT